jgi:hypothetical protein
MSMTEDARGMRLTCWVLLNCKMQSSSSSSDIYDIIGDTTLLV